VRPSFVLLTLLALCGSAGAQDPPKRDGAIELLVADAYGAPPEFTSDALIRISSLARVDKAWRRELLNEAFMRAYGAPEQYRRTTTQQIPPDSRQGAQCSRTRRR